jgi:hypothetical protein
MPASPQYQLYFHKQAQNAHAKHTMTQEKRIAYNRRHGLGTRRLNFFQDIVSAKRSSDHPDQSFYFCR